MLLTASDGHQRDRANLLLPPKTHVGHKETVATVCFPGTVCSGGVHSSAYLLPAWARASELGLPGGTSFLAWAEALMPSSSLPP
jgi:hypothetical protein